MTKVELYLILVYNAILNYPLLPFSQLQNYASVLQKFYLFIL